MSLGSPEHPSRATCYDCARPLAHCLCGEVSRVDNRTGILILQHPRERSHAFGTARLAEMSLERATVLVEHPECLGLDRSLGERLRGYGLLFPHPSARDLSRLTLEERPKQLVVLDGTWSHARSMYRNVPALRELPHYTLPEGLVSGFRIRKQPEEHCLSTLEAIYFALRALEPETPGLDGLLRPFHAMQTQQLLAMQPSSPRRKRPSRHRRSRRIPRALTENPDSLVVAYGESSTVGTSDTPRRLLTLTAERLGSKERLQVVLEEHARHERHLPYMRLSAQDLAGACTEAEMRSAWQAFARPGDVVAAWSKGTLDLLRAELPDFGQGLHLKAAYFNLGRARGSLEEIVVQEQLLSAEELAGNQAQMSRPLERLRSTLELARFLRSLGNE